MNEIEYLKPDLIREVHKKAIIDYGGVHGEVEPGSIDYLSDKPSMILFDEEMFPGIFMKAACYLVGFASNQYFADGNKRTGASCCMLFLALNGYDLKINSDDLELFYVTKKVANDDLPEDEKWGINEVAHWLEGNSVQDLRFK